MSVSHKSSHTQVFRLMLYRRALHPELFGLTSRRLHKHGGYTAETWVQPGGHVVRFSCNGQVITETVIERGDHLPETGLMHALPCLGEKDYELKSDETSSIGYFTTIQTESLTDNLYLTTYREMLDFAEEADAMYHTWTDEDGSQNLSMLDVQKYKREFHFQSYHLMGATDLVLRTQSIFEARR